MPIKVIILVTLLLLTGYDATARPKFVAGQWQTDWLLAGPFQLQPPASDDPELEHLVGFETDFIQNSGGERNPIVVEGADFEYQNQTFSWRAFLAQDSIVDLDAAVSKLPFVAAYAFRQVDVPRDQICLLSLGSNDGARVWLNGAQVWDRPLPGGIIIDDALIPVFLHKGNNTLLIKVEERGNVWGFCARFLPLERNKKQALFFRIAVHKDGSAALRFLFHEELIASLFEKAFIEIVARDKPDQVLWSGDWNKAGKMELPINADIFGNYLLHFRARLVDGRDWSQDIPFTAGARHEYVLFKDGRTKYEIVLSQDAAASAKWAAEELQHWLQQASGAFFPIVQKPTPGKSGIFVGAERILDGDDEDAGQIFVDDDESFRYENRGGDIFIRGGRQRGIMYGVMSFLENELGVRWYTPTVTRVARKQKFVFNRLVHSESPGVRVRNDFYYEAFNPLWAARNKVNGAMNFREQPGGVEAYWAVHTFYRFMPPEEFYDEHPEYYSLIDGKRVYDHAQLCLTNPDVLRIVTERLKQTIREHPDNLIYSVSQNDWRNPCQCDRCQAIAKREKSEAGPVIWFVNKVAEGIEKEFPDKYVGTLAYQYTRTPPKKINPRHNVVVRLCSIECCFAHDFKSCPENTSFLRDLQGWAAVSPQLYIWDYVVNFSHYIMPYPNFRVLQANIQAFRDNKAIGIMEQAAYQSRGGEFAELRAYLLAKLLWNPEADVDGVIDDFMYGYYGRSGQYVRQYFDLLHDQLTPRTHIHLGLTPDDKLFSDEFVREAEAIFDKAEVVADDEEVRQRVEMARLPLMYLKCKRMPVIAKYDGTYQRFSQIVEREGITHYAERGAPQKQAFHREVEAAE